MTSDSDPWIGREVGSYRLERLLGRGGMGRVYVGLHPTIGSRVAIKILSEDAVQSPDLVERFLAEARTVGALRHDHIAAVHDFHTVDGRPAIVMELVDGRSLREIVKAGTVEIADAISWSIDVLAALAAAHAIGVIHRDLKPDNIMITTSGRAMLLDFGIAKLAGDSQGAPRTRTGAVIGTPQYMSPEQIQGEPIDLRSDIYSLGIVMYELLGRKRPFEAESDFEMMIAHVETEPAPLEKLRPELPRELVAAVKRALSKRPSDRFPSAGAMAKALGDTSKRFDEFSTPTFTDKPSPSTDAPTRAAKPRAEKVDLAPTAPASPATPTRSKRPLFLIGLAVVIAAVAGVVMVTKKTSSPKKQPPVVTVSPADAADAPVDRLAPARAAEGEGKLELAIARYVEAYEAIRDPEILFRIGELYERMDRTDDAVRSYERYIASTSPDHHAAARVKIARLQPPLVPDAGVARTTPSKRIESADAGVPEPAITGPVKNCRCYGDAAPVQDTLLCNKARYVCGCMNADKVVMCPVHFESCPSTGCPAGVSERRTFAGRGGVQAIFGCPTDYFSDTTGKNGDACTGFDDGDLTEDPASAATATLRSGTRSCGFCAGSRDYVWSNQLSKGRTGERCTGYFTHDGKSYDGHRRCE